MPTFLLYIKADLENVSKIEVPDGGRFCIDVKVMKFAKDSRNECSINVVQVKGATRAVTEDDDGKWVPVVAFECRGIEPTAFHPEDGFLVTSRGNKKFSEADLSDDWVEFDDKINESVGIYSIEAKFELHKGK